MNLRRIIFFATTTGLLGLSACGDQSKGTSPAGSASAKPSAAATTTAPTPEATAEPDEKKAGLFFQIPADGGKVFAKFDVLVSMPDGLDLKGAAKGGKDGQIVVLPIDEALAEGETVPDGVKATSVPMEEPMMASLELEPGKQKITVQVLDGEGKVYKPELAKTIEIEVVEDGERMVEWLEPKDGATVKSPFKAKFGVKGMEIVPAGKTPKDRTTGHHHVLVNQEFYPMGKVIPADDTHIHYGKGQTEAELKLPKGKHKLALQFADGTHASYGKSMAAVITVTVE